MSKKYTDLTSNFPDAVDTIDKMQDLTTATKGKADTYYSYIEANNITGANSYLGRGENSDLRLSVFNAEKYNALRDSIVATQRVFRDSIDSYLGDLHDLESVDGVVY